MVISVGNLPAEVEERDKHVKRDPEHNMSRKLPQQVVTSSEAYLGTGPFPRFGAY